MTVVTKILLICLCLVLAHYIGSSIIIIVRDIKDKKKSKKGD